MGDAETKLGNLAHAAFFYRRSLNVARFLADSQPDNKWLQGNLVRRLEVLGSFPLEVAGAMQIDTEALAIASRLVSSDPGNLGWKSILAHSYGSLGNELMFQGRSSDAGSLFRKMLAVGTELTNSDARDLEWQQIVASAYKHIARAAMQMHDLDATLAALRHGKAVTAHLSQVAPDNAKWKGELAWFNRHLSALGE